MVTSDYNEERIILQSMMSEKTLEVSQADGGLWIKLDRADGITRPDVIRIDLDDTVRLYEWLACILTNGGDL